MAKKQSSKTPDGKARSMRTDRFYVGQHVILVLGQGSRWERANGEAGTVVSPRRNGVFHCAPLDGGGPSGEQAGFRYEVLWKGGISNFEEEQLRPAYDGNEVSTWAKFAKATGLRLNRPIVAQGVDRTSNKSTESGKPTRANVSVA